MAFKGHLPAISLETEVEAWRLIEKVVDAALAKYKTTIE